ncbi:MAG TPA: hypothetical protein VGV61_02570, partial [Thermoanaerobaculia bacterium]|nr:hypothetical protein [Thermoanaerobaculia bacterium]
MNRGCVVALVAALAFAALMATPPVREEIRWRSIAGSPDPEAFHGFLVRWPHGRHRAEARLRLEQTTWAAAAAADAPVLHDYLARFPAGVHVREARARLEELLWQEVIKQRTAAAFDRYLRAYPQGRFAGAASAQRQAVLADDTVFAAAQRQGDRAAYETFLANYPGHAREAEARAVLADIQGRDLFDLLAEKKVEARATGDDITSVSLKLRRKVHYPLRVVVPVGTFFAARDESAQSMVTVASREVTLTGDDWESASVDVACADLHLDIPSDEVGFTIRRAPAQRELQKLMPVLAAANADQAVRQAAVWILSDDASYEDLGTLVQSSQFNAFGGTRMINAPEAVRALQLLAEAG